MPAIDLISRLQMLGEDFGTEVEGWQIDRVRDALKTNRYFHGVHYPKAFQIDGRKYVRGLAALAKTGRRADLRGHAGGQHRSGGIRKRIVTPSARLRASHIVLAGNVHLGAPCSGCRRRCCRSGAMPAMTEPLGERLAEAIDLSGFGERHATASTISASSMATG